MFVGRGRVLAQLNEWLSCRATLVTLWGAGGVGRSRTAREIASDKACLVDLATARSGPDFLEAFAASLSLSLSAPEDGLDVIGSALASRALLAICDDADRLEDEAKQALETLTTRHGARVLVTARRSLGLPSELAIELPPLDENDALALFQRARSSTRPSTRST